MTENRYDPVVLGGGAAAFAAIAEAHRRGKTTALVNAGLLLGGRLLDQVHTGKEVSQSIMRMYGECILSASLKWEFNWSAYLLPFLAFNDWRTFRGNPH